MPSAAERRRMASTTRRDQPGLGSLAVRGHAPHPAPPAAPGPAPRPRATAARFRAHYQEHLPQLPESDQRRLAAHTAAAANRSLPPGAQLPLLSPHGQERVDERMARHVSEGGSVFLHAGAMRGVADARSDWQGLGRDSVFVGMPSQQNRDADAASRSPEGLVRGLERRYGVDPGQWGPPESSMYQAVMSSTTMQDRHPRLPVGTEAGAIPGRWMAGGVTDGGRQEAVTDPMSRQEFEGLLELGHVKVIQRQGRSRKVLNSVGELSREVTADNVRAGASAAQTTGRTFPARKEWVRSATTGRHKRPQEP